MDRIEAETQIKWLLDNGYKAHRILDGLWVNILGDAWSYAVRDYESGKSYHRLTNLTWSKNNVGYLQACVRKNGRNNVLLQHRLIMETFYPSDTPERNEIDHKDRNKLNNTVENLHWVTKKENANNILTKELRARTLYNNKEWQANRMIAFRKTIENRKNKQLITK